MKDFQRWAAEKGGKCLTKTYYNSNKAHFWQCNKGHVFTMKALSVKHGGWCPQCRKLKREPSIAESRQEKLKRKGGKCLSENHNPFNSLLKWQCKNGHVWEATQEEIMNGWWCPECLPLTFKHTIEEMQELAVTRNGKCLSEKYISSNTHLKWECEKGHIFKSTFSNIKHNGMWCKECNKIENKNTLLKQFQLIAEERKGKCLSEKYINNSTQLKWQCEKGHVWESTPYEIKNKRRWCTECEKIEKDTAIIKKCQIFAQEKGGNCISKKFINHDTPLMWQCKNGHKWEAKTELIKKNNFRCSECEKINKGLDIINRMKTYAKNRGGKCLTEYYENFKIPFKWECDKGHKWKAKMHMTIIGAWCPKCNSKKLKLSYKKMQQLAAKKNGKCLSEEYINNNTPLKWQCEKGHTWETQPRNILSGTWCPQCALQKSLKTIDDMRLIALKHNGKCLSKKYINANKYLKWQCAKGHIWKSTYNNVHSGKWCPECFLIKENRTIEAMQELAAIKKGKCLSEKYINSYTPLKWQCEEGHIWETQPRNIRSGTWCPTCNGKPTIPTIEGLQLLAANKNGICISKKYINSKTKLTWQCNKGHTFRTIPYKIQKGAWCSICRKEEVIINNKEMHCIAAQKKGQCLSYEYIDSKTPLKWECEKGHIWRALFYDIQKGDWCPICRKEEALIKNKEIQQFAAKKKG